MKMTKWLPLLLLLALPAMVQAQFTYWVYGGAATVTGWTGSPTVLNVPSTENGHPVTSIQYDAFFDCYSLNTITITNSVTSIGFQAFYRCTSLTNVIIGTNVTSIGYGAFTYCSSLTSITFPRSVTSLGTGLFPGCTSLTTITVDTNNPALCECGRVLFNKSQTLLIQLSGGVPIWKLHHPYQRHQHRRQCVRLLYRPDKYHHWRQRQQSRKQCVRFLHQSGRNLFSRQRPRPWIIGVQRRHQYHRLLPALDHRLEFVVWRLYCRAVERAASLHLRDTRHQRDHHRLYWSGRRGDHPRYNQWPDGYGIAANAFYDNSNLTSVTIPDSITNVGDNAFYGLRQPDQHHHRQRRYQPWELGV